MSYTETTTTSWFSRMKSALAKIIVGLILIIGAIVLMFWNEGRSIHTYQSLMEGEANVVSVDSAAIDPANEGKLVHISGPVKPSGTPQDGVFGISAANALQVSREIEMYQWVEKSESKSETKLGGSEETVTTYRYSKEWRSDVVDSSDFKQQDGHQNPDRLIDSEVFVVDSADVGAFTMKGSDVAVLGSSAKIPLDADDAARFEQAIGSAKPVKLDGGSLYAGASRSSPQVGDLRITYQRVDLAQASFVGAQRGDTLGNYTAKNGYTVFLSAPGAVAATEMFASAQSTNTVIAWLIRIGGLVAMFIGFTCIFSILGVIGDIVPIFGSIIRFGTSTVAFILTLVLGPLVIAIAWFAYRPLLALAILAVAGAIVAGIVYLRRKPATAVPETLGRPTA